MAKDGKGINGRTARKILKVLGCALLCSLSAAPVWADGAVYAMTNALGNNQILVYHRASDGSLNPATPIQVIATGGGGSGLQLAAVDTLGSSGGLKLDEKHRLLFAVNTETAKENTGAGAYNQDCNQGTITSFRVASDGTLTFADRVPSGGLFPDSLTVKKRGHREEWGDWQSGEREDKGDLLYVLNAGGPGICNESPNITGFRVERDGHMHAIGSVQAIDPGPPTGTGENCPAAAGFAALTGIPAADFQCGLNPPSFPVSPAEVAFTPDGNQLIVTVKGTSTIYVFPVDKDGSVDSPTKTQATLPAIPSYFGFTFDREEDLLVTELFGSATTIPAGAAGAVSSFKVTRSGDLVPIISHVGNLGTATCWITLEPKAGNYAYVANSLSNTLSSYTLGKNGTLTLLAATAAAASGPNDMATAKEDNASFLYVVDAGTGTVGGFQINLMDGSLIPLAPGTGLPLTSAHGLAAY